MPGLEDPLTLPCGVVLRNRLCKAAMTEGLADEYGRATVEHERLYKKWAQSGCGLLLTGNFQIDRRYLERPGNVCIDGEQSEQALAALRRYAQAGTSKAGVHCWTQISHGGRQSNIQVAKKCPAPSAIRSKATIPLPEPYEMSIEEIEEAVRKYAHAARVSKEVGFTGVQLHSAHGYLLSSFLNPLANQRSDRYGGSLENRARFLLECIRAVRKEVGPSFPVAVKLNSSDFQKGGFTHEESVKVAKWLDEAGLDLLEISGGNYENAAIITGEDENIENLISLKKFGKRSTALREAYFLKYAKDIRKSLSRTPLMVTGGFRSREVMEDALESESAEIIGIGRPLCVKTDCVQELLDRKVQKLPSPENEWDLPWIARWTRYLIFGNLMKLGGEMMSYYWNLYRLGAGEKPLERPNLLRALLVVGLKDDAKARNLKGLPENDPTVRYYNKSSFRKGPIILILIIAFLLYRRS